MQNISEFNFLEWIFVVTDTFAFKFTSGNFYLQDELGYDKKKIYHRSTIEDSHGGLSRNKYSCRVSNANWQSKRKFTNFGTIKLSSHIYLQNILLKKRDCPFHNNFEESGGKIFSLFL